MAGSPDAGVRNAVRASQTKRTGTKANSGIRAVTKLSFWFIDVGLLGIQSETCLLLNRRSHRETDLRHGSRRITRHLYLETPSLPPILIASSFSRMSKMCFPGWLRKVSDRLQPARPRHAGE